MDITFDTSESLTTAREDLDSTLTTAIAAPSPVGGLSPIKLETLTLVAAPPGPLSVLDTAFPDTISTS